MIKETQMKNKIIAIILLEIMIFSYLSLPLSSLSKVFADFSDEMKTNNENVGFNAFFLEPKNLEQPKDTKEENKEESKEENIINTIVEQNIENTTNETIEQNDTTIEQNDITTEQVNENQNNEKQEKDTQQTQETIKEKIEKENKTYNKINNIEDNNYLYAVISVKNTGYLKDGKIEIKSSDNKEANFKIDIKEKTETITDAGDNYININRISYDEDKYLEIPISALKEEKINPKVFKGENKLTFSGIYVDKNGKEKRITKEIKLNLNWTSQANLLTETTINKYINYEMAEEKGVILQQKIDLQVEKNILPVNETNIEVKVPTLKNVLPSSVSVYALSLLTTNGDEIGDTFNENNYEYNQEKGILTINIKNQLDEENKVSWKEGKDELIITYKYGNEAIAERHQVELNTKTTVKLYDSQNQEITNNIEDKVELTEQIGSLVDFSLLTNTTEMYKGFMYSNAEKTSNKNETPYNEILNINIGDKDLVGDLTINILDDSLLNNSNQEISAQESNTYIKTISFYKSEFLSIFGEEGSINVDNSEFGITTITKDIQENKDGKIVIDISNNTYSNAILKTSKPVKQGNLEISIEKTINPDLSHDVDTIRNIEKLRFNNNCIATFNNEEIVNKNIEGELELKEPTSEASLSINPNKLSTVISNKNVEFKVILKTNSPKYKLYKNPVINIDLPEYIENIELNSSQIEFDEELKIQDILLNTDDNNKKSLQIILAGEQKTYNIGSLTEGTNILLNCNIEISKTTPSLTTQVRMTCQNENIDNETIEAILDLELSAPIGLITTNEIEDHTDNKYIVGLNGENQTATIKVGEDNKTATFKGNIINNSGNKIKDLTILGRFPKTGISNVETNEDLNTNLDINVKSTIELNGIENNKKIYYSENGNATDKLEDTSNNWKESIEDISKIKSYLIKIDGEIENSKSIEFNYTGEVGENLDYNLKTNSEFIASYINELDIGEIKDNAKSSSIEIGTGEGPKLNATLKCLTPETYENGETKYELVIKNEGTSSATNVEVNFEDINAIPVETGNGTKNDVINSFVYQGETEIDQEKQEKIIDEDFDNYDEEKENEAMKKQTQHFIFGIKEIQPGQTIVKEVNFKVNKLEKNLLCKDENHYLWYKTIINSDGTISYEKIEGNTRPEEEEQNVRYEHLHDDETYKHKGEKYSTNIKTILNYNDTSCETEEQNIKIEYKEYFVDVSSYSDDDNGLIQGGIQNYKINVKSNSDYDIKENTKIIFNIPKDFEFSSVKYQNLNEEDITNTITYTVNNNTIEINMGDIDQYNTNNLIISLKAKKDKNKTGTEITGKIDAKVGQNDSYENIENLDYQINIIKLSVKISSSIQEGKTINGDENFNYLIEVYNESNVGVSNIEVKDILPKELSLEDIQQTIIVDGKTQILNHVVNYEDEENKTNPYVNISIASKETAELKVNVLSKNLNQDTQIKNFATINNSEISEIKTNEIVNTILKSDDYIIDPYQDNQSDDNGNNPSQNLKRISGMAWNDENKNGRRDENESKLPGINVALYDNSKNAIATNNGEEIRSTTDKNGTYTLSNIQNGNYTVIFFYDTTVFETTIYNRYYHF